MALQKVTLVHHIPVDFTCPARVTWEYLLEMIPEGGLYRQLGYQIELKQDSYFYLGGYHMRCAGPDGIDEADCRITECDQEAMRLSLHAEFAAGRSIFASYQIIPVDSGSRLLLDSHFTLDHFADEGATAQEVADSVKAFSVQIGQVGIAQYDQLKRALEARL